MNYPEIMKKLVGRKIVHVEHMDEENAKELMWYSRPVILFLDDGTILYPMRDDEGNDGGALGVGDNTIPVLR